MIPSIKIEPSEALVDERLSISIRGLHNKQEISVYASIKVNEDRAFDSYAHYEAGADGTVNLSTQPSRGGSYEGVEPMGLFWAMKPSQKNKTRYSRFLHRDVEKPVEVVIKIFDSHVRYEDFYAIDLVPLAETSVKRWYKSHQVRRVPVRFKRVRGTLFIPEGRGPFPAVIDLFGGIGGLVEFKASLLASRGILALALAYFNYEDLPETMSELDLSYFEEAKEFLDTRPDTRKNGIGVIGVSLGGTLALACATYIPGITCAVSINGSSFAEYATLTYNGRVWHARKVDMNRVYIMDGALNIKDYVLTSYGDHDLDSSEIEIQKTEKSFLFIFSEADEVFDVSKMISSIKRRAFTSKCDCRILTYPGAGHLLEPPYSPHTGISLTGFSDIPQMWGGKTMQHALAQEKSWKEIVEYLKCVLAVGESKL